MLRVLVVLGTRPEAVKLAPLIRALRARAGIDVRVCVTGQHREMLQPILELFDVDPDYDLDLMTPAQTLSGLTAGVVDGVTEVIDASRPSWVVVQGDTTTALAAALAAFYRGIAVAHVEAGLRTNDMRRPFPEEANRRLIDVLADLRFAPTERARQNLLREGCSPATVRVTGNTGIDALHHVLTLDYDIARGPLAGLALHRRIVLVTAHRRESFGRGIAAICQAVLRLVEEVDDIQVVYPVHLNPSVRDPVREHLGGHDHISLIPPLDYASLVQLMHRSTLILTDSGGIQEEAPSLGRPVLVLREVTERPEAVEAGCARVVGTNASRIVSEARRLLKDSEAYRRMAHVASPFGDGRASARIVEALSAGIQGSGSDRPSQAVVATPDFVWAPVASVRPSVPNGGA
ncbi:MAG TPA: UDP-N-acetylglucosamine 2-epimerase (non-hydrolyzing) [Candidatus Limnocylindria bacterium]|jgi:UDP-N-acetylglucosamine 2-epimerase (non-hydrolysing)|nr:UDP-N-acetylglucosamine 2-epimerase (non-hydrolyzing) [Candidatus Limnocylindria bacterium]